MLELSGWVNGRFLKRIETKPNSPVPHAYQYGSAGVEKPAPSRMSFENDIIRTLEMVARTRDLDTTMDRSIHAEIYRGSLSVTEYELDRAGMKITSHYKMDLDEISNATSDGDAFELNCNVSGCVTNESHVEISASAHDYVNHENMMLIGVGDKELARLCASVIDRSLKSIRLIEHR